MRAILDGLKALGAARLAAMGGVAAVVLGLLAFMAMRGTAAPMALLYADLDLREAGQIVDQLEHAHIAHGLQGGGSRILVAVDQVDQARLLLARQGLPSGGSVGYEIFDRGNSLTETSFQQRISQTRALEGEISRTIRLIHGVRGARVNLVLPQREPFARDQQAAQAGVVLTMEGAQRLDKEGVQAILNLVAAAVPGLKAQNIAIVDSRGDLLARAGEATGSAGGTSSDELRRATEMRLSRAVEQMLERSLGAGQVRAEAAVTMDFDRVNETQETYNPDQQVVRSQQNTSDNQSSTEAQKSVTVQNNLPNADAGNAQAGTQEQRRDETTNYEIGKTVRTLVREQPQIKRISLAVMVNGIVAPGPDGKPAWQERTPEDLARIATPVRSAIGYDAARGDKVEVVQMRFVVQDAGVAEAPHTMFGLPLGRADLMRLAESALLALVVVVGLLFVLRPMAVRLIRPAKALAAPGPAGAHPPSEGVVALPRANSEESLVDVDNVEGQMRLSSIKRVSELVERYPGETLGIVRTWLLEGVE